MNSRPARTSLPPPSQQRARLERSDGWTILAPTVAPLHFRIVQEAMCLSGYNFEFCPDTDPSVLDLGVQFVNNDACFPSMMATGQMIFALQSGRYDLRKTALLMTQTGGGCRASNYVEFIRRGLRDSGFGQIPLIGVSVQSYERHPGFALTPLMIHRVLKALVHGDVLMRCLLRTRPYELVKGSADALYEKHNALMMEELKSFSPWKYAEVQRNCIREFDDLPLKNCKKPRVGVVGEIYVKFNPIGNNNIVKVIEGEGAECVLPDIVDFVLYCITDGKFKHEMLSAPWHEKLLTQLLVWYVELYRRPMKKALKESKRFDSPITIWDAQKLLGDIVHIGNIMGEGWLLTAEMIELIHSGVPSIACVQPFACLPNHVTGKGMIKELRRRFPEANIAAIDYDAGASEVNQLNRLKLLLANAPIGSHPDENKIPKQNTNDHLVRSAIR
jgi:predicted nucleotide-binding protein (sugar kinase/HSP70/actin superfamily)